MKKVLFLAASTALVTALSGCSSTPDAPAAPLHTLRGNLQKRSAKIIYIGGLSTVGVAESMSLHLALNHAKKNGRIELATLLESRVNDLQRNFVRETGIDAEDPVLAPFRAAIRSITQEILPNLVATELKYEINEGGVTAYALMELNPRLILDRLAEDEALTTLLRPTLSLDLFQAQMTRYEIYKASQNSPVK